MAPRQETGTSRAQGKCPVEPSQPEQTEACQKARETDFEAPTSYDTYDEQSLRRLKFEKAPDDSWIRRAEQQARGQGQMHPGAEDEAKIREMEDGLDP
uniref:Uncharacterized protein n=1 Tax=Vitis vinifera TaxID=29760 RepID=A5BTY3_VITVI|nr:hypothetical protein VITISV_001978 [Vitis vinifera]